jgi:hypothetical protein
MSDSKLTAASLISEASRVLEGSGFSGVRSENSLTWPSPQARVFEDVCSIVAVVTFDTVNDLLTLWSEAQAVTVELISGKVGRGEGKSWDGYLVLLTGAQPAKSNADALDAVRYDVSHLRKVVGTGCEIGAVSDVSRILLPVLPLEGPSEVSLPGPLLGLLPSLLAAKGIPEELVRAVVDAFEHDQPLVKTLHSRLTPDVNS